MRSLTRAIAFVFAALFCSSAAFGQGADIPVAIASDVLGNVYVTGASMDSQGKMSITTVMFDAAGNTTKVFDIPSDASGPSVPVGLDVIDSLIVVSGSAPTMASGHDILTAAFNRPPLVSVQNLAQLPATLTLDQNYPNPVRSGGTAAISYGIPEPGHIRLVVVDMMGREVAVLADEFHESGTYRTQFQPSTLPSGSYLYMLTTSSSSEVRKLTVVR